MIPLVAAIILAGAAGAGPVLVSDACGTDTTEETGARCAVEDVEKAMQKRTRPKELKIEAEGKLFSVPDDVEMVSPGSPPATIEEWWKALCQKVLRWSGRKADKAKSTSSESESSVPDPPSPRGDKEVSDVRSAGEHSCQICYDQDHSTAMLPCGHGGLCWDCGLQIYALTEECPMCRTKIEVLVQLDMEKRRYAGDEEFISVMCE